MIIDIVNYSLVIPQLCPIDKLFVSSPSADLDTIPPIEWSPWVIVSIRLGGGGIIQSASDEASVCILPTNSNMNTF